MRTKKEIQEGAVNLTPVILQDKEKRPFVSLYEPARLLRAVVSRAAHLEGREDMTKEEAIALAESKFWETMSYRKRAVFQINEKRLCMPFDVFHEAVEKTIGRPVYTHEFGLNHDGIKKEINGEGVAPTLEEIINMIPAEKRIIVAI